MAQTTARCCAERAAHALRRQRVGHFSAKRYSGGFGAAHAILGPRLPAAKTRGEGRFRSGNRVSDTELPVPAGLPGQPGGHGPFRLRAKISRTGSAGSCSAPAKAALQAVGAASAGCTPQRSSADQSAQIQSPLGKLLYRWRADL